MADCMRYYQWSLILNKSTESNKNPRKRDQALNDVTNGHGFKVDTFNDSQEALSNFKPGYYDLVILDIKMPNNQGIVSISLNKLRDLWLSQSFDQIDEKFDNEELQAYINKLYC